MDAARRVGAVHLVVVRHLGNGRLGGEDLGWPVPAVDDEADPEGDSVEAEHEGLVRGQVADVALRQLDDTEARTDDEEDTRPAERKVEALPARVVPDDSVAATGDG